MSKLCSKTNKIDLLTELNEANNMAIGTGRLSN
jgi:hypothetical protein